MVVHDVWCRNLAQVDPQPQHEVDEEVELTEAASRSEDHGHLEMTVDIPFDLTKWCDI